MSFDGLRSACVADMKGLFPQFAGVPQGDFSAIWKDAVFVFDTNVLLNLYRYRPAARDQLLNILNQLSPRIWIPHHVGLEFQRNRLNVIAEQIRRFAEVRRTVERAKSDLLAGLDKLQLTRRQSPIDPSPLTSGFMKLTEEFIAGIDSLEGAQQKVSQPDPLKDQIESLFDGRIGSPPSDQAALEELYKEADVRFAKQVPPGFRDANKDKNSDEHHVAGGLCYRRKYGDFVVWKQLLQHAKSAGLKSVIFITDDAKEDWWWIIESDGPKTIGPRPELIEEARLQAGIGSFLMYSPELFLKYANDFLKAAVSKETLEEVRDVSNVRAFLDRGPTDTFSHRAERAVFQWLKKLFDDIHLSNRSELVDFVAETSHGKAGFEVKSSNSSSMLVRRIRDTIPKLTAAISAGRYHEITLVLVVPRSSTIRRATDFILRDVIAILPSNLKIVVGRLLTSNDSEETFQPYHHFVCDNGRLLGE